eukprot:4180727-Heterocapsa_arctica.AAC.1
MILTAHVVSAADVPSVVFVLPGVIAMGADQGRGGVNFRQPGLRPSSSSEDIPKGASLPG